MAKKTRRSPVSTDKRFKKPPTDIGPAERWQHGASTLEYTEEAGVFAVRAMDEHVLDKLFMLRQIDAPMREAGLRLFADYTGARLAARVGATYSGLRSDSYSGGFERNEGEEKAYHRWRDALAVLRTDMRALMIQTACDGLYPAPIDLARVQKALQHLALHYRIPNNIKNSSL